MPTLLGQGNLIDNVRGGRDKDMRIVDTGAEHTVVTGQLRWIGETVLAH